MNQVGRLEKSLPRAKSEGYVLPDDTALAAFAAIASDLRADDPQQALSAAQAQGYELLWYTDRNDNHAPSYLLREIDPSRNGWGLYVFRAAVENHIIVEAPHPLADADTPSVAVSVYRTLNARSLLIAGAHRDANRDGSADAAHSPRSVFQAIHESEVRQSINSGGSVIVLQIHGFASSGHPAYPHVIVSYEHASNLNPAELIKGTSLESRIAVALEKQGVTAGTCSGGQWRDLCGATNIQGTTMTQGVFIHLELDESVRQRDKRLLAALADALGILP